MHISAKSAGKKLENSGKLFLELFNHKSLSVEIYKPLQMDFQTPHDRDEVYIIISGKGDFINNGEKIQFNPGDFIFVAAGVPHRFENFSLDFSTWVIFYEEERN